MTASASLQLHQPVVDETVTPVDLPGRWVGGAVGAGASVAVGLACLAVALLFGDNGLAVAAGICALGVPIGFVIGRHLSPVARDGRWQSAFWHALLFGLLAPALGAVEILSAPSLAPWTADAGTAIEAWALLVVAIPISYVVAPLTIVVGIVWVLGMRLLPADLPARLRAPRWLEPLGVRHAVLALATWAVAAHLIWALAR